MAIVSTPPDVFIVGAGFSKAIDDRMPDTDALGRMVIELPEIRSHPIVPKRFPKGGFETWLSMLASEQPYLTEPENLERRALFGRVARALVGLLTPIEADVLATECQPWLYDLLSVLHFRRTTVISLNYDTLIEAAVLSHSLWDSGVGQRIDSVDILRNTPPSLQPILTYGGEPAPLAENTFRLIKLHGSLDWFWMGQDPTGLSLVRRESFSRFGAPSIDEATTRSRELLGREPFLVPPTVAKSEYYRIPVTRMLWAEALEALELCARVFLVGYSLPPADLVMLGLLETAFQDLMPELWIVNPSPEVPLAGITSLGIDPSRVNIIDTSDCVATLARKLRDQAAAELVDELRRLDPEVARDYSMWVAWGHPKMTTSPSIRVGAIGPRELNGDLLLEMAKAPASTAVGSPDSPPSVGDLLLHLDGVRRLVALMPSGQNLPLVGGWRAAGGPGVAPSSFLTFAPAGTPPSVPY
jgi:hypothetical protein